MAKSKREKFGRGPGELGGLLRQMMTGQQQPEVDNNFEHKLDKALDNVTKSTELQNKIDALNKLQGKDSNQNNNILSQLKDFGLDLSNLIGTNQEQLKTLAEIADKERKARIETEEKALDYKKENKSTEMEMFMKIMEMQQQQQRQQIENFKEMIISLKDELKDIKIGSDKNNNSDDPIREASKKLVNQALEEKLNYQPQDPVQAIMNDAERLNALREVFGGNQSDIDREKLDLRHQLELRKIEMEDKWRREEAEKQREIEEKKLQKWDSMMNNIQQVLPAIAQTLASNNQNQQEQPPGDENILICRNCGQQLDSKNIPENCPKCGAQLVKSEGGSKGEAENE